MKLIDHFDDVLEQKQVKEELWPCCMIETDQVAWVPYGWVALAAGLEDMVTFTVIPWLNVQMYKTSKYAGDGAELLVESVAKTCKKLDNQQWKGLGDLLSSFLAAGK